jgi:endonuclease III
MATQSKAQLLNEIHTLLKKRYKPKPDRDATRLSVLEAVIYGICHEGTTREQANQALSRFKDGFFDWNEIRVSSIEEVQAALNDLPDSEERAQRIRRFLRQLFERTYGFTLDTLAKKPLKESLKVLHEYEAFGSDFVTATVIQQSLGGHAIPVDAPVRRALERLGVADETIETPALRSILERAVPKNRGTEFADLIEELAHDTCVEGIPDCPRCELRKTCPTARVLKEEAHAASKASAKASKDGAKAIKADPPKVASTKAAAPKATPSKPAPPKPAPAKATAPKAPAKPSAKTTDPVPKGKPKGTK